MLGKSFDIAGKVFLMGEYAVLGGLPALVASIGPRFSGSLHNMTERDGDHHPESPVGRLLRWTREHRGLRYSFHFKDPYQIGGFGASTAQFAIAYKAAAIELGLEHDWQSIWRFYRDLVVVEGIAPSGADLVAQLHGGVNLFDPASITCVDLWATFDWSRLLVFSPSAQSDRKVATHKHLKEFFSESSKVPTVTGHSQLFSRLAIPLREGLAAIEQRSIYGLGQAMNEYAEVLAEFGLEARATFEDRQAIGASPGVCGVKGSGAMQADVILVLIAVDVDSAPIIQLAYSRGLRLINNGLTRQRGITCHS
jgi:mevalonate kinase